MAPSEFVRDMFNGYALTFDESLKALRYQSPELLRQAVDVLLARLPAQDAWAERGRRGEWRVFDGGCGTGLCGPLFRNLTRSLSGVDLSENMVALARKRGVYDELAVAELVAALASWSERQDAGAGQHAGAARGAGPGGDVVLAADVLVYFGNLSPFLDTAAQAVRARRGLVAFTTELLSDDGVCDVAAGGAGWKLTTSGRYAHCHAYVAAAAAATGVLQVCPHSALQGALVMPLVSRCALLCVIGAIVRLPSRYPYTHTHTHTFARAHTHAHTRTRTHTHTHPMRSQVVYQAEITPRFNRALPVAGSLYLLRAA